MLVLWLGTALAAPDGAEETVDHVVSVTLSPLHLVLPVAELTAEIRAADRVGVAAVAGLGFGRFGGVWEGGGSGRFYPVGDFDRGVQVGAEVLAVRVVAEVADYTTGEATYIHATGFSAGGFVGGKYTLGVPLTFDGQIGAQALTTRVDVAGETWRTTPGLLLNLNVGWSF